MLAYFKGLLCAVVAAAGVEYVLVGAHFEKGIEPLMKGYLQRWYLGEGYLERYLEKEYLIRLRYARLVSLLLFNSIWQ
jgi:hypothetical protein